MTTVTTADIAVFAEKVERLCEFLLEGMKKDGSEDVVIIQKLQEDATDLQTITQNSNVSIDGLSNYMKGVPNG